DLIVNYSMIDAKNAMGDQWVFNTNTDGDADAATTTQNIELSQDVNISGVLDLAKLGGGLILPDMAGATCNGTTEGQMFRDAASSPPAVMVCQSGSFVAMSGTAGAVNYAYDFDPNEGNCTIGNSGPFALAGTTPVPYVGSDITGVWAQNGFVFAITANGTNTDVGLGAYSFNGTDFTLHDYWNQNALVDIWGDGTYIYVAARTTGVVAYTFDGSTISQVAVHDTPGQAYGVWGDGTYIYVADNNMGVRALSFDGTSFTELDDAPVVDRSYEVNGDGTYIYAHDRFNGLKAFSFDGTTLTQVGSSPTDVVNFWVHDDIIYVMESGNNLQAMTFDGSTFTDVGAAVPTGGSYDVWHNGQYVFAATSTSGVKAFSFDGSALTQEDAFGSTRGQDVAGDGTYVYVADRGGGLDAYSGFECLSTTSNYSDRPDSPNTGVDYNYRTYSWGNEAHGELGNGAAITADQVSPTLVLENNEFYKVSSYSEHACGLKTDGSAWCWGEDYNGALGNGATITADQATPYPVSGGHIFIDIAAGRWGTCALKENGTIWCWGDNTYGQLGNGAVGGLSHEPAQVININDFIQVDPGRFFNCGLRSNGETYCWGQNNFGQLGNGDSGTDIGTPTKVNIAIPFVSISAGYESSCALSSSGDAWCWGDNAQGQLGNGSIGGQNNAPNKVVTNDKYIQIDLSHHHTCGLVEDGTVYCWGDDRSGQLGNGATITVNQGTPTQVASINDFVQIETGAYITCGIHSSGTAYCWGRDDDGALGNGAALTGDQEEPTLVENLTNVVDISCHHQNCIAATKIQKPVGEPTPTAPIIIEQSTTSGETMDSHGLAIEYDSITDNDNAGVSFTIDETSITGSDRFSGYIGAELDGTGGGGIVFQTDNGGSHTEAHLSSAGALALNTIVEPDSPKLGINRNTGNGAWNANRYDLGLLTIRQSAGNPAFYGIDSISGRATILSGEDLLIQHGATDGTSLKSVLYLENTGFPRFFGDIFMEKRDANATVTAYTDTADETAAIEFFRYRGSEGGPSAVVNLDHLGSLAFQGFDGTNYSANGAVRLYGQAAGAPAAGNAPARIRLVKEDGTNHGNEIVRIGASGALTIGTTGAPATGSARIAGQTTADNAVKAGNDVLCASADDVGTVRFVGTHYEYCKDSPYEWESVIPNTCKDDATIVDIGIVRYNTCVTFSNGQSACVGLNDYLQIGTGDTNDPILNLNPIKTYKAVQTIPDHDRHACGIADDRRIKCWGRGRSTNLGLGVGTSDIPDPVHVASTEKYKKIAKGRGNSCALRQNGLIDCWGNNRFGNIGIGNNLNKTIPTLVPYLSDMIDVSAAEYGYCGVKSDGTAWCWGKNDVGQLGLGRTSDHEAIPQQVKYDIALNSFNDIIQISTSGRTESGNQVGGTCALKSDGTVWCWGDNTYGQIGNGTSGAADVLRPIKVSGITNAVQISRQGNTVYALLEDGTIEYWGEGINLSQSNSPSTIAGVSNAVKLADGPNALHMCWILEDGRAQCYGMGSHGILGNGSTSSSSTPVDVINPLSCNSDKYVFVTSTRYDGDLGGLKGADNICQAHADRANLPGRYLAWLADDTGSPATRYNRITTNYKLVDETIVSNGWDDLTDGTLDNPIIVDQNGTTITANHQTWTNVKTDGTANNYTCNQWTSNSSSIVGGRGNDNRADHFWTEHTNLNNCNLIRKFFCFQQ
ncbi:MAG: DUF1554 domain-containing protein, partial [Alphaproteobacteria bacterium]|nr:DUF1554 domain-containing protein [Alphaproteobacteria bacterium]